jgi:protein O-GlcNAc transferase
MIGGVDVIARMESAVAKNPAAVQLYPPLVQACASAGQIDRALIWQQKLIALQPRNAAWQLGLAKLLFDAGRAGEAIGPMNAAIAMGPADVASCYNNLGVIYDRLRDLEAAADAYRKAIQLQPTHFLAYLNLGHALLQLGQLDAAETTYQASLRLDPSLARAHAQLGLIWLLRERPIEAIEQLRTAVRLDANDANAHSNMALSYVLLAEQESAIAAFRRAHEIAPDDAELHSQLIAMLNYVVGAEPPVVFEESRRWGGRHERASRAHGNRRDADRVLRIGYISPDFRNHSVGTFIKPVLVNHDRGQCAVVCYANVARSDAQTQQMKEAVDLWRDIVGRSDDEVAEQIRADEIDILVDLAGHSIDNRLGVLARKPAPIGATWIGYHSTTGLKCVDYRITDRFADPPGMTESFGTEMLWRLPDAFFVYSPPEIAPPLSPLPMLANGHVTFGSFNTFVKIRPMIVDIWVELLKSIPDARFLMAGVVSAAADRARGMLMERGIAADRIEIVRWKNFREALEIQARPDIALDSFPWNGHTTTCHSLWMGVPVVSLAGSTAISRAGASVLGNLGLAEDWLASTPEDYVRLARRWAEDPDELAKIRGGLRERMRTSALCDVPKFMRGIESAYRSMWRKWCER